jgi:hypothetical protein
VTAWHEEPIGKKHNREAFDCGEEALNDFFAVTPARATNWAAQKRSWRLTIPIRPFSASTV